MNDVIFGYEDRSKRLIERLDRIQNYLQSLPPLPKTGTAQDLEEEGDWDATAKSSNQPSSNCSDSDGTSSNISSVSTKCQQIPKDDCCSELLQQALSQTTSQSSVFKSAEVTPNQSVPILVKEKKKKIKNKVQDPLRPTNRNSFGMDIGQALNVIDYIKQNHIPGSKSRSNQLIGIITKEIRKEHHTDKSLEQLYRQLPLPESSVSDRITRWSDSPRNRAMRKEMANEKTKSTSLSPAPNIIGSAEMEMYRVRYLEQVTELSHNHGLDMIQQLFVPHVEHNEKLIPIKQFPADLVDDEREATQKVLERVYGYENSSSAELNNASRVKPPRKIQDIMRSEPS